MTKIDRFFEALKIMHIETAPSDTAGRLALYADGGHTFIGVYGVDDGLDAIKRAVATREQCAAER